MFGKFRWIVYVQNVKKEEENKRFTHFNSNAHALKDSRGDETDNRNLSNHSTIDHSVVPSLFFLIDSKMYFSGWAIYIFLSFLFFSVHSNEVENNTPVIKWNTRVDLSGTWAYRVCVSSSSSSCVDSNVVWDSGFVWQENEPFDGTCHYDGPMLAHSITYFWTAWEWQLSSASGSTFHA
jgi:hypothetical protein